MTRPLRPRRTAPHIGTLIAITALAIVSLNLFLPSLPSIAAEFGVSYAAVSWSIAGYLLLTGVLQLIMGPLSDRLGRRPVMLAGLAVFALASVGCALAPDFTWFLAFRFLQAAIASCMTLGRAVVRDMYAPREATVKLSHISAAMALAPMLGPLLGGLLEQAFGWRANFWAFALMGGALYALVWYDLGETNNQRSSSFKDQFRNYPELFRARRFWGYTACLAFSIGTFHVFLAGAPLIGTTTLALSPATLGLAMGASSLGFLIGTMITGRIAHRHSIAGLALFGRFLAGAGVLSGLLLVMVFGPTVLFLFGASLFVGFGNGFSVPPANAGTLSVRPNLAGSASGLSGAITVTVGAVLTWAVGIGVTTATDPAIVLLALMLGTILVGLAAMLWVRHLDRTDPLPANPDDPG